MMTCSPVSRPRYKASIAVCISTTFFNGPGLSRFGRSEDFLSTGRNEFLYRRIDFVDVLCCQDRPPGLIGVVCAQWYQNQTNCGALLGIHCGTDECHQSGILKSLRTSRSASSLVMPASTSSRSFGLLKISSNNRRSCLATRHTLKNCITRYRTLCIWRSWTETQDSPQLDI